MNIDASRGQRSRTNSGCSVTTKQTAEASSVESIRSDWSAHWWPSRGSLLSRCAAVVRVAVPNGCCTAGPVRPLLQQPVASRHSASRLLHFTRWSISRPLSLTLPTLSLSHSCLSICSTALHCTAPRLHLCSPTASQTAATNQPQPSSLVLLLSSAMSKGSVDMEQSKVKKILDQCLKEPYNRVCAECAQKRPLWASSNLGVFVCIRCRSVGASRGRGGGGGEWTR